MQRLARLFKHRRRPLLGVDIGATRVRLLELDCADGANRVLGYASVALPDNAVADYQINDAQAVAATVSRALERSASRCREASIAVSGPGVISKVIDMPAGLTDAEREAQIQIDAEHYIPYPIDEVNLDFRVVERHPSQTDIDRVLLVACRRDHIEMRIAALEMARLSVRVVDVEAYALQNACRLLAARNDSRAAAGAQPPAGSTTHPAAVFDISESLTRLTVQRGGDSIYTREISFGCGGLTTELIARFAHANADQLWAGLRAGDIAPAAIEDGVADLAQRAAGQIERALQFYRSTDTDGIDVQQVIVTGSAALFPGFEPALARALRRPLSVGNPLAGMLASRAARANHVAADGPALMIAAGMAMRGLAA